MIDSEHIPAIKNRRNRDTEHVPPPTSCKRIKFDDVIFRPVLKDESSPDLKVECVSDDVISEICLKTKSTESSSTESNEATSRPPLLTVTAPSAEEIDEFFKEAENYQHKKFLQKYNFDIVKDVPIEGRYEWVKLN